MFFLDHFLEEPTLLPRDPTHFNSIRLEKKILELTNARNPPTSQLYMFILSMKDMAISQG